LIDLTKPVEIADNIFWVGYNIPNDPFQCHVYLIRNDKESVLVDPGSKITYQETRRKIKQIINLNDIKYFIAHHQDPDIVSCMQDILDEIETKDRYLITHWRAWALLKHYNWGIELYEIEDHACKLKLNDRTLHFIATPYLHFAGAFCTFDDKTRTLFSSDIFGGFTDKFELFAKSADDYFEKMKPFHEHYMPSNIILNHGLDKIEEFQPINLIAPQHGSIIKKEFIKPVITKLRQLECGLFGKFQYTKDVIRLSKLNEALNKIIKIEAYQEGFFKVVDKIVESIKNFYDIDSIKAYISTDNENEIIAMDSDKRSISIVQDTIKTKNMLIAARYLKEGSIFYTQSALHKLFDIKDSSYIFPVKDNKGKFYGICFITLNNNAIEIPKDLEIMHKFQTPISMSILNERRIFCLENKSKKHYEESIKDPLTGLFNRRYMTLIAKQEFERARRFNQPLSVLMLDIDHFKIINDTFSHQAGDVVLQNMAEKIKNIIRSIDTPVRYGGEEFLIFLPNTNRQNAIKVTEKIRQTINESTVEYNSNIIKCTISGGVASTDENTMDNFNQLIAKSDQRLYEAKNSGRNRVV
jgi:diguanylate cyclase (GGDEF)-like protein